MIVVSPPGRVPGSTTKRGEAVGVRRVAHRRPGRVFLHIDRRTPVGRGVEGADGGDHAALRRVEEQLVRWTRRAAAADHHVHGALGGVDHVGRGRGRDRRQRRVGFPAADRVRALVVVLVPADHEIDAVLVEQRHPFLADAEVGAVELVDRRDRDLVHADDDPVDVAIAARRGQLAFQPRLLRAAE